MLQRAFSPLKRGFFYVLMTIIFLGKKMADLQKRMTEEYLQTFFFKLIQIKHFVALECKKSDDPVLKKIYDLLDSIIKEEA